MIHPILDFAAGAWEEQGENVKVEPSLISTTTAILASDLLYDMAFDVSCVNGLTGTLISQVQEGCGFDAILQTITSSTLASQVQEGCGIDVVLQMTTSAVLISEIVGNSLFVGNLLIDNAGILAPTIITECDVLFEANLVVSNTAIQTATISGEMVYTSSPQNTTTTIFASNVAEGCGFNAALQGTVCNIFASDCFFDYTISQGNVVGATAVAQSPVVIGNVVFATNLLVNDAEVWSATVSYGPSIDCEIGVSIANIGITVQLVKLFSECLGFAWIVAISPAEQILFEPAADQKIFLATEEAP